MKSAKKRILLLSLSIGAGHIQAARAVTEEIKSRSGEYSARNIDLLSRDTLSLDRVVRETYFKMIDFFPLLYDLLYHQSQQPRSGATVQTLVAWGFRSRIQQIVDVLKPDLIACTHPFPCAAASLLKKKGELKVPLVGIMTDFDIHKFWLSRYVDFYCVPTPILAEKLAVNGISPKLIRSTGIPIMKKFYEAAATKTANEPGTILIMGGGLGFGNIVDVLRRLDSTHGVKKIIVVTGHNITLYDAIADMKKKLRRPLELHGYTDQVPQLMARASLLVTKPGALTCTEAFVMRLPMVLVDAIPGQEEANARHLEKTGCARWLSHRELSEVVGELMIKPELLVKMSSCCQPLAEKSSTKVVDIMLELLAKNKAVHEVLKRS